MIVAGTGHRPNKLGGYSKEAFDKLVNIAELVLKEKSPTLVISGMALGWDQALAQAAINLSIPFTAAVPFRGQEFNWPISSQQYYKELLLKATEVEIVSEGIYTPDKMQVRNKWMVDQLGKDDILLAMFDGSSGGTYNCVQYAKDYSHCQIIYLIDMLK